MDVIELLNDLLGGQLLLWKVILTSLVFTGAGLQVWATSVADYITAR